MRGLTATNDGRLATATRFVDGWLQALAALSFPNLQRQRPWRVLVLHDKAAYRVFLRERDRAEEIGGFTPGDDVQALTELLKKQRLAADQVVLRLAPDEVVRRELNLPLGARDVIEPVLRNQLERLTPWPVEQVVFDYEIDDAARQGTQMSVGLTATSRKILERSLAEVRRLGLEPGRVDWGPDAEVVTGINLLPQLPTANRQGARTVGKALAILAFLAVAVGAVGLVQAVGAYRQHARLAARIGELRSETREVRALADEIAAFKQKNARVLGSKTATPAVVVVLEALSRSLPDSAWLTELNVKDGKVTLSGKALNSSGLIALLEASSHFANVRFSAPTTRQPGEREETFSITADVVAGAALDGGG